MQIVIDIPDGGYQISLAKIMLCLKNYKITELPKGHGALKDIDAIISEHTMTKYDWTDCVDVEDLRKAPTIIEADKEVPHDL